MELLESIGSKLDQADACEFKIGKQLKRMNGDWEIKYGWELYDGNNQVMARSVWEGFDTFVEALIDLEKNIK